MKGCEDYSANIQLYLDKELRGQDLEEFRAHLETCAACERELAAEEELSRLLHETRPLYAAPQALRDRIMQASVEPTIVGGHAPDRLQKRVSKVLTPPTGRRVIYWQALAASIVLLVAGLLVVPGMLKQSKATDYVEAAIAAHRGFMDGSLPLEVKSDSPSVVAGWFAGKVPFNFRLPVSQETSGQEAVYKLTGARLVNYKGSYAALVAYQMQKEKISLLIASDKSAPSAGGEEVRSSGLVFHYRTQADLHVITWSNHGLTYALVSSLPGTGQRSCLVCHQNMPDSDHFTARR